jgi:hypothetical protein
MSQNNKKEKKEKTREDYLDDLRKLGVRETTHEKEGITRIRINFPFRVEPEHTENGKEE